MTNGDAFLTDEGELSVLAAAGKGPIRTIEDVRESEKQKTMETALLKKLGLIQQYARTQAILDELGPSLARNELDEGGDHDLTGTKYQELVDADFYFAGPRANAFVQFMDGPPRTPYSFLRGIYDGITEKKRVPMVAEAGPRPITSEELKKIIEEGPDWNKYMEKYWDFVGRVKSNMSSKWKETFDEIKQIENKEQRENMIEYYNNGVMKDAGLLYACMVPIAGNAKQDVIDAVHEYTGIDYKNLDEHFDKIGRYLEKNNASFDYELRNRCGISDTFKSNKEKGKVDYKGVDPDIAKWLMYSDRDKMS